MADRSQLSIMQVLCEGANTDVQIATVTGLSQSDISFSLDRLLDCGCVQAQDKGHLVLYGLNAPRLLQLEGIVDDMLIAALKGRRSR
ncbi:MAG TPA: ArsR family transcriptional regulator [Chthoniobacterales bacterium]|nr:ArsR family transcriptional regulator [Chthoniobacterales bacterium]